MLLLLCMGALVSGRRHSRKGRCHKASFLACSSSDRHHSSYHHNKNFLATDRSRANEIATSIRNDIFNPKKVQDFVKNYQAQCRATGHEDWLNMRLTDGMHNELDYASDGVRGKIRAVKRVLQDSLLYSKGAKNVQWSAFKVREERRQGAYREGMAVYWKGLGQDPSGPYQTHLRRIERIAMTLCHSPYPGVLEWTAKSDTYESRFFDVIVALYLSVWRSGKVRDADTAEGLTYELMAYVLAHWRLRDSDLASVMNPKVISAMTKYVFPYFGTSACEPSPEELREIERFVSNPVDIPINLRLVKHTFRQGGRVFFFRLYHYIYVCAGRLGERPCSAVRGVFSPPSVKELLSTLAKVEVHIEGWWRRIYLPHL